MTANIYWLGTSKHTLSLELRLNLTTDFRVFGKINRDGSQNKSPCNFLFQVRIHDFFHNYLAENAHIKHAQ